MTRKRSNWFAVAGLALTLLLAPSASASPITGSMSMAGIGVAHVGIDLTDPLSMVTSADTLTTGVGIGDFLPVPIATSFGPFSLDVSTLGAGGGFTLTNGYGTFVAASGVVIPPNTTSFLNVRLLGTFAPGALLLAGDPTLTPGPAGVNLAITESGGSHSASLTLSAPPVPEPGSLSLVAIGLGLLGLGGFRRQRRQRR